eukprot:m.3924 g.3924  ORF g.3924 m.3924 type:complete len:466 (+) comp2851_c0_seq1:434-1831(+)
MSTKFQFYVAFVLAAVALVALEIKHKLRPAPSKNDDFNKFQMRYLVVFMLATLADWLQGPYLYRLYEEYGYLKEQIAALYIVGYISAMISGPLLGELADKHGRKRMSVIFCGLYSLCCLCKLSSNFFLLLCGRVLGGLSTALLLSTFESWMIFEHNKAGFPSDWLPRTFALATYGSGVMAVLAGILANLVADCCGHHPVRPFLLAVVILGITAILVKSTWNENKIPADIVLELEPQRDRCIASLRPILKVRKIYLLGGLQACFESAMYTFVFLWTPGLDAAEKREHLLDHPPLGIIFASFMVAVMLGSSLFRLALQQKWTVMKCLQFSLAGAAICLGLCSMLGGNAFLLYLAFFGFELSCGVFFPAVATMRGKLLPEKDRAGIMGWFRVPLNIIVVILTFMLRVASQPVLFGICSALCVLAYAIHQKLEAVLIAEHNDQMEAAGQVANMEALSEATSLDIKEEEP